MGWPTRPIITRPSFARAHSSASAWSAATAASSNARSSGSSEISKLSRASPPTASLRAAFASSASAASSAAAAAASAAALEDPATTRLPFAASSRHTCKSATCPTRNVVVEASSFGSPLAFPSFVSSSSSSSGPDESASSSSSLAGGVPEDPEGSRDRSRALTVPLTVPLSRAIAPKESASGTPATRRVARWPPAPPPPSLLEKPTTASTPGSAASRCSAHASAAARGMASTLFSTSTSGFLSLLATCAYSAGGVCSSGCLASTTKTATSARSRTRQSWRHTSMFCSNAGACPLPDSMSLLLTEAIQRTNALRSRLCSRPRSSS